MAGISSDSMKSRNLSAPPAVGNCSDISADATGLRSRVRSVFTTATKIISGTRPRPLKKVSRPAVWMKWVLASRR